MGSVLDEVIGPDMTWTFRPQPDTGSIIEPEPALLCLLRRDLEPLALPLAIVLGPMAAMACRSTRLWFTCQPEVFSNPVTMRYP